MLMEGLNHTTCSMLARFFSADMINMEVLSHYFVAQNGGV